MANLGLATSMHMAGIGFPTRCSCSAPCIWVTARGTSASGRHLTLCSASQADQMATQAMVAQQLVTELAAARGEARRGLGAAQVLDAWSREREHWAAAVAAERARWRRRVGGAGTEPRRVEAVWRLVGDWMDEWHARDRSACMVEMHLLGMVVGTQFRVPAAATLSPVAERWARKEVVTESRRWEKRKSEADGELRRLLWELADYELAKWDAEDGAGTASPVSDDDKEKEAKREKERDEECLARTGLASSGRRRALLRAYLDSPGEAGSKQSRALLEDFLAARSPLKEEEEEDSKEVDDDGDGGSAGCPVPESPPVSGPDEA